MRRPTRHKGEINAVTRAFQIDFPLFYFILSVSSKVKARDFNVNFRVFAEGRNREGARWRGRGGTGFHHGPPGGAPEGNSPQTAEDFHGIKGESFYANGKRQVCSKSFETVRVRYYRL